MYENLINSIRAAIKANGNQEITGPILQNVLVGMVDALGAGVPCGGVISPGDTPSPLQPIFYLAGPGTYNAAGLTTVGEGCIGVAIFDGSSWAADTIDTGLVGEVQMINDALAVINATLADKMNKVPTATDGNVAEFDNGSVKDSGIPVADVATKDNVSDALKGRQELLVAGAAEGILGPSASTGLAQVLTAPSAGVSIVDAFKGRTLKWNQGAPVLTAENYIYGVATIADGVATGTQTEAGFITGAAKTYITGHMYLAAVEVKLTSAVTSVYIRANGSNQQATAASTSWQVVAGIFTAVSGGTALGVYDARTSDWDEVQARNFNLYDLTDIFGAGNEPATVAEFEALFPNFPYSYNAGTLLPFKGTGLKVVGFNQWDEQWEVGSLDGTTGLPIPANDVMRSKNYCYCIGGSVYCVQRLMLIYWYDSNKKYISRNDNSSGSFTTVTAPANAAYFKIRTYSNWGVTYGNNLCINISNAALNGTYKPYTETVVNIDAIGKSAKDADGNPIVPFPTGVNGDGTNNDEYGREGGTLRWGVRAYEAGDESDATVITDGTNTVYPLDADVPFTWDEPFTLAFTAEEGGTIWLQPEDVDEAGVPVTAPMNLDIAYTTPAVSIITETTLRNMLDQFKAAGKIASYTMTPDGNGNFNFIIS